MKKIKLNILETSDVHGAIFPIHYGTNKTADHGLARLSTAIKQVRKENDHVLLVDNGDFLQGTPLASFYYRSLRHGVHPMIKAMNYLQYDAAVLGNHEFNYGMEILSKAEQDAHFPFLSANILHKESKSPYFGRPYFIKNFASGIKAAVLGITTSYIPNWEKPEYICGLSFTDVVAAAQRWVHYIREVEKPDIMIVSYHGGFEIDLSNGERIETKEKGENQAYRICREVEGIDVLLTGHQHRITAEFINGVAVVQPGFSGAAMGQVTAEFTLSEESVKLSDLSVGIIEAKHFIADKEILELVKEEEQQTQKWLDEVIGTIEGNMEINDPFQVRLTEHPLIELINRVQMEASQTDISCTALFHNGSRGLPTEVTMRDIVSNYIYPNSLAVIEITGEEMKKALERSASYFTLLPNGRPGVSPKFSYPKPQHYNYDMWEGIGYTINLQKAPGSRIEQLTYHGEPVEANGLYQVVLNNYRAGGGGDYLMFKGKKVIKEIQTDMSELLADYIKKQGTVKAEVNHNWKVLY
ncbi:2', 3'-cyclic nucleotide 2'-phosphodiesterase [Bacillus sp. FJAT-27231]|uniref:bifunctional metallophosphatase/5'-nucleotidase n=1 Tax=Bacillus sp. FJAT-27231 TaxID=1679168 RepID=UPI0006707840|nr:bifunctional UDP-sugar hydrolase/5'-nucleotidase [Bacillus sp. FJAT-27231]KMY53450.1 2', 3'-cyclic nucleotide 2'-phosphodiesterase [Bacillus sp. FJAT-27231]